MSLNCPSCGKPVPPSALQGLCPECMLKLGVASQTEATGQTGPHGTKVASPPPPRPEELARFFPQLEILECLGRGGMGAVYKARQPLLNRFVALKILAPEKEKDPQFAERFMREAQALARLNHPNIVTVYDFGAAQGLYYLLMEYVDGMSLRQLLQSRKVVPEEALAIVPRICEALQYAHEQGIVHRDIKPENVLLDKQGRVKIADFGIAKLLGQAANEVALTGAREVVGTPYYMAPEQVEKPTKVDHRADIYSLGVVFYEMLTGELPLGKFAPPSRKVQVDVRLDEVVLHALEKEPDRRYQQAGQVKKDVETIATTGAGSGAQNALAVHAPVQAEPEAQRKWILWWVLACSIIGLPAGLLLKLPFISAFSMTGILVGVWELGLWKGKELSLPKQKDRLLLLTAVLFCSLIGLAVGLYSRLPFVCGVSLGGILLGCFAGTKSSLSHLLGKGKERLLLLTGVLFVLPSVLFLWFVLFGETTLGLELDLEPGARILLGALGWPASVALGLLLAVVQLKAQWREERPVEPQRWSWLAIAAVVMLGISLPLAGAAVVWFELLRQEPSWNPATSEALFTVACFLGTALIVVATIVLGVLAQRQIARAGGQLRGGLGALATTWYWPWLLLAFACALVFIELNATRERPLKVTGTVTDALTGKPIAGAEVAATTDPEGNLQKSVRPPGTPAPAETIERVVATTAADGRYTVLVRSKRVFLNSPNEGYVHQELVASAPGYANSIVNPWVRPKPVGRRPLHLDFALLPTNSIPGEEAQMPAREGSEAKPRPGTEPEAEPADVADVPTREMAVDGNPDMRFFLIGQKNGQPAPANGCALLLVLPGGDGSADFLSFVRRIYKNALPEDYLIAELIAPKWDNAQAEQITWPTATARYPAMKFSTEAFIQAVIREIEKQHRLDARRIFALGWSSGGPPVYAASLSSKTRITGAFVAMSVFQPYRLPGLDAAKGRAYYILHSPDDTLISMSMPYTARDLLAAKGGRVKLATYEGGHGWRGDVYGNIRAGIQWLEENAELPGAQ